MNHYASFVVHVNRVQKCEMLCSVAELFLTDLCFHEHAEDRCERAVQAAVHTLQAQVRHAQAEAGKDNDDGEEARWHRSTPDAFQLLASLRLSQQRPDDALQAMQHGHALWWQHSSGTDSAEQEDGACEDEVDKPPLQTLVAAGKLWMELLAFDRAVDVFEVALQERDDMAEVRCGGSRRGSV